MLVYKKENGFPMTIMIETGDHKEVMEDGEIWEGYESIVSDDDQNIIGKFHHSNLRDRVLWAKGFFEAIEFLEKKNFLKKTKELFDIPDPWKDPETILYEDGHSNLEVGDWIVRKDGKVQRITHDDDPALPWKEIARFASRSEAKNAKEINELLDDLKRERALNKSAWDTYGSELCAGEMIRAEEIIEKQIEKLRNADN